MKKVAPIGYQKMILFLLDWDGGIMVLCGVGYLIILINIVGKKKPTRGAITHLRSIGYNKNPNLNKHPIGRDILQQLMQKYICCQSCGTRKHLLPDHKNDDYNDLRVLDKKTQLLTDFQLLCNSCNIKKARENKKNKEIGKRTPAPYLYTSIGFPNFIEGDDNYISGIDAQKGTFWYDIEAYKEFIKIP